MDLYNKGDYDGALKEFIMTLEKGEVDVDKRDELNRMIHRIFANSQQTAEVMVWIKEQAELGNSYAQYHIGDLNYFGGSGSSSMTQNVPEAVRLYTLSANQGNSFAMCILGFLHFHGYATGKKNKLKGLELILNSINFDGKSAPAYLDNIIGNGDEDLYNLYVENKKLKAELEEANGQIKQLKDKNRKQAEEIERLRIEIEYTPGGSGYEKAKENAEKVFSMLSKENTN